MTTTDKDINLSRRSALMGSAGLAAAAALPIAAAVSTDASAATSSGKVKKTATTITTKPFRKTTFCQ